MRNGSDCDQIVFRYSINARRFASVLIRGHTSCPPLPDPSRETKNQLREAGAAFFAAGLHAVGDLVVTAFVAVLVFEKLGVGILRRAWFNLDLIWSAALIATGTLTLML